MIKMHGFGQVNHPRGKPQTLSSTLLLGACCTLLSTPAHAYLDPGSGGLLMQLLLGGVAGMVVVIKLYWHRLLVFLKIREPAAPEDQIDSTDDAAPDQP